MPNTNPDESPNRSTAESEAVEIEANRRFADQEAEEMVEGLRKVAAEKQKQA